MNISGVTSIGAGGGHTAVAKTDGTVWTWGDNEYGQLGNSTNTDSNVPVQANISDVLAVAAGVTHTVALKSDGTVWAWGYNYYGQLGNGNNTNSNVPVQANISDVVAITAGGHHTVALKSDGTAWTWGWNYYGQLGNSTNTDNNVPVQANISGVVAVAAGVTHTVAITSLFHDVLPWFWAYDYIMAIYDAGITTGYPDGTYRPAENVSRAQMAAFIIRANFGESFSYSPTPHFTDIPDTHWAFKYIQKMYDRGDNNRLC